MTQTDAGSVDRKSLERMVDSRSEPCRCCSGEVLEPALDSTARWWSRYLVRHSEWICVPCYGWASLMDMAAVHPSQELSDAIARVVARAQFPQPS